MARDAKAGRRPAGEAAVRALLERHGCPLPFHAVRTRFLGGIATPVWSVSPMRAVEGLWGGELPVFDDVDEANTLIQALVPGLWNDLTRHQKRSQPFRLVLVTLEPTAASIGRFAGVRLDELDGFIEGLFGGQEEIDLPERAHAAVGHLGEMRAMMAGICELLAREPGPRPGDDAELPALQRQLRGLTRIMEAEIHEAVLSCTRARRQALATLPTGRTTLH